MTETKLQRRKTVLKTCLSAVTIIAALQAVIQVWILFLTGGKTPYTSERISQNFYYLCISLLPFIGLVIANGILIKEPFEKPKAYVNTAQNLERIKARLPMSDNALFSEQQKRKKFLFWVCFGVCSLLAIAGCVTLLTTSFSGYFNAEFFESHVEAEKMVYVSILTAYAIGFCALTAKNLDEVRVEELVIAKEALANNAKAGVKAEKREQESWFDKLAKKFPFLKSEKRTACIRIAIGVVGVTLFIVGIANGGMGDVLNKAIKICEQCIGLG